MVSSYTQLLARRYRDALDQDARDFIDYAVDGASRMQGLIQDLLSYSRVGTRGKRPQPTACAEVLAEVLRDLEPAIEESGAEITVGTLPTVLADRTQLGQVLRNLVGNALKFRGEGPPRVEVSARRAGDRWALQVSDQGPGIDPAYHERVFEVFQRLHAPGELPGTGIGLAIVKKIVERHGGEIRLDSALGEGARFTFTLPACDAEPSEEAHG